MLQIRPAGVAHFTPVRVAHIVPVWLVHYSPVEVAHYSPVCSNCSVPWWRFGTFSLVFHTCAFPLTSPSKVPAVPHKSPNQDHATSTPDTAWPVNRFPPDFSWSYVQLQFWCQCVTNDACTVVHLCSSSLIHTWHLKWRLFRNAHDRGFWPKPLTVVCNLLLQADCEGPTLISHAASLRHTDVSKWGKKAPSNHLSKTQSSTLLHCVPYSLDLSFAFYKLPVLNDCIITENTIFYAIALRPLFPCIN